MTTSQRILGIACILYASIVWGTTGTVATFAPEVSAAAIGAAAMGIGGLLQASIAVKGIKQSYKKLTTHWKYILLGGVAVATFPLSFYASMRLAGVTIGTVVSIGSAPLFAALIEYCIDGFKLSKRWCIGAALGVSGIVLLSLAESGVASQNTGPNAVTLGVLLGLLAGLTYAIYSWSSRRMMLQGINSTVAMGVTFGLGGLLLMPVLLTTGAPFLYSWNNALVGIYMALIPMFTGYLCFGYGLARVQASIATTITLFEPVVAAVLAVIIVGERLLVSGWIGIALIIACLICITAPVKKQKGVINSLPLSTSA